MDMLLALRLMERIVAVIIGGLAIYLGYRLFLRTPVRNASSGKFDLPMNTSIVLTRVGPGVFFALFGTAIVGISFYKQIDYREGRQGGASAEQTGSSTVAHDAGKRFIGAGQEVSDGWRDSARSELRKHIAVLNTVPSQLNPSLSEFERSRVKSGIDHVKFALMEPVWADWGDKARFKQWIDEGKPVPSADLAKAVVEFEWPQTRASQ